MKNYMSLLIWLSIIVLFIGTFTNPVQQVSAQTEEGWTEPVNLSKSGSSTNPTLVIDAVGTIHVVWFDQFEGYKYAKSTDGAEWTAAKTMRFPFSPNSLGSSGSDSPPPAPVLLADQQGRVHALWRDGKTSALYYSNVSISTGKLDLTSSWSTRAKLADSVIDFNAQISSQGILHVGYVSSLGLTNNPVGVFYRKLTDATWSSPKNVYFTQYFRSLDAENANVRLAVSEGNEFETIYMVWDDRPQKRIFMASSPDAGENWEEALQIVGPEDFTGTSIPFNADIGVFDNKVLLTWQIGLPGEQCTNYSEWSISGGKSFEQPVKVTDQFVLCPETSEFILLNKDLSVVLFNVIDDIILVAWNGSRWSEPHTLGEIAAFLNPVTLDSVILGCQKALFFETKLYVVGCDKGNGGDIWFSSRSLGGLKDWFPSSSTWNAAVEVTEVDQEISSLSSITDSQNNVHTIWVQNPLLDVSQEEASIQYANWNGKDWSSPVTILSGFEGIPVQLNLYADGQSKLLLTWVDSKTGDMFLSWANVDRANIASEWNAPQFIPSVSQANSSPDILVDASGRILVMYAIPINEQRGIYFVESDDNGMTWREPLHAFDAASAGWELVDQPKINITGDGRLHMLFRKYSFQGEQRRSLGLYYSQSADGGATWSSPETVSENSVAWSHMAVFDRSTVHRLWQEDNKSTLVTLHQASQDSGQTWSNPAIVSRISENISLNAQAMDTAGNLYFFQVTSNGNISVVDQVWNGSGWNSGETKEFYNKDHVIPSAVTASITSTGDLLVSVSIEYPNLPDEARNEILSVRKSLELPEVVQTSFDAILPDIEPTTVTAEETSAVLPSPTPVSPLAALDDSTSFLSRNKNLIGLLLLSGVLALVFVLFRPDHRDKESR